MAMVHKKTSCDGRRMTDMAMGIQMATIQIFEISS